MTSAANDHCRTANHGKCFETATATPQVLDGNPLITIEATALTAAAILARSIVGYARNIRDARAGSI